MPRLPRQLAACPLALGLALLAGCSSGGPETGTVNGEVTVDRQPLKKGMIRFVPPDGKTPSVDAAITDGKFTAQQVPVGEMRVQISSPKIIGKKKLYDTPDSPTVEQAGEETLPARYNTKSDLKFTVKRGTQDTKFELQSK